MERRMEPRREGEWWEDQGLGELGLLGLRDTGLTLALMPLKPLLWSQVHRELRQPLPTPQLQKMPQGGLWSGPQYGLRNSWGAVV